MTISSASDVFFDQLKDLFSAKQQIADTLPDLIDWAEDLALASLFESHEVATREHLQEIDAIFKAHSEVPGDEVSKAIAGLIEGGNNHIEMAADPMIRNFLLVAHTRRIAFYIMAASEFTRGAAIHCGLSKEAEAVEGMLISERRFAAELVAIGFTYGLEIGEPGQGHERSASPIQS